MLLGLTGVIEETSKIINSLLNGISRDLYYNEKSSTFWALIIRNLIQYNILESLNFKVVRIYTSLYSLCCAS